MTPHTTIIVLGSLLEQCMRDDDLDLITIRADGDNILLNKTVALNPQPPVVIRPEHYITAIVVVSRLIGESPTWDELRSHLMWKLSFATTSRHDHDNEQ